MLKNIKLKRVVPATAAIVAFGLLATPGPAQAQTAIAVANSVAVLMLTITLESQQDLLFGDILPGTVPSNVVVTAGDAVTPATISVPLGDAFPVTGHQHAIFGVSIGSTAEIAYDIVLPAAMIDIVEPNTNAIMKVGAFKSNPSGTGVASGSGLSLFFVGASLFNIQPNQQPGVYTGTFSVTVTTG